MRITWTAVEQAAALMDWKIKREKGRQSCTIDTGGRGYDEVEYAKDRALLHCLAAALFNGTADKIREEMEWAPAIIKGKGLAVYDWSLDTADASLAAVCSRIWPNSTIDS